MPLVATPGSLLAGFQFPTYSSYVDVGSSLEEVEVNVLALNPLSAGSEGGFTWATPTRTSFTNPTYAYSFQFVSLTPVILPAG